ncbi:MAG: hypothetical protein K2L17_11035 [Muribaculaceae bacterium]|nr:hypothetical protein [Muribaculaceae bacterium]
MTKRKKGLNTSYIQPYEAIAPRVFSIKNIDGLVKFVQDTERYCRINRIRILKVNLENVVKIDMYAISLLLSMLNKLSSRNINYWGTYPNDRECKQYIMNSGFLNIVQTNVKKPAVKKTKNQIFMIGKDRVDTDKIGRSVRESMQHILGREAIYSPVYDNMCEISVNSVEYANEYDKEKNWLVSISVEEDCLHFILSDTGQGILRTLRKKKIEKLGDVLLKADADIIKDVFLGKYQSATGEINRHKGLPMVYESFTDGYVSNFQILTNKVMIDFEKNFAIPLKKEFNGVLYSWTVSLDNYNKWRNLLDG